MSKNTFCVGIEIDARSMRAVRVKSGKSENRNIFTIDSCKELQGTFVKDEHIIDGLKEIHKKLPVTSSDTIITSLGGKQTYASQLAFKKLPDNELKTAIKLEIRKNIPFDTAGSTIEYQFLNSETRKDEISPMIVSAVANALLQRQLRLFEKAGLPPSIVDIFPLVLANLYHTVYKNKNEDDGQISQTLLHVGPDFSTLVIDGSNVTFFNRTIYFSAAEIYTPAEGEDIAGRETDRRIAAFIDEISRSLAFYETTHKIKTSNSIIVTGNYIHNKLLDTISESTGLTIEHFDFSSMVNSSEKLPTGTFDTAFMLGLRGLK